MKKSKIKLLTATACLALIGTASAAWVYAGTATASANIGVKVASYASAGEITVTGNDKINVLLDNGSVTFVRDSEDDKLTAKHNVPTEFASATNEVTKEYLVVISPTLATYVTFNASYGNNITTLDADTSLPGGISIAKGSKYLKVANDDNFTWEDDTDVFTKLPTLTYAADMAPSSETDYKNMINYFKADTIDSENWEDVMNNEWNVTTDLNSDAYVQIIFAAIVQQ